MNDDEAEKVIENFPVSEFIIPASTYQSLEEPSRVVSMWNFAIANCDVPESLVYEMVKLTMENNDKMVSIHKAATTSVPENYDKNNVRPGIRVQRAGLTKTVTKFRKTRSTTVILKVAGRLRAPACRRSVLQGFYRSAGRNMFTEHEITTATREPDEDEDHILAHNVDEEPVEANRRLFEGCCSSLSPF